MIFINLLFFQPLTATKTEMMSPGFSQPFVRKSVHFFNAQIRISCNVSVRPISHIPATYSKLKDYLFPAGFELFIDKGKRSLYFCGQ